MRKWSTWQDQVWTPPTMLTASRSVKIERAVTDFIIKMDPIFHLSQTIWSSTKNLTALAMACLVDRGLLSYSDK